MEAYDCHVRALSGIMMYLLLSWLSGGEPVKKLLTLLKGAMRGFYANASVLDKIRSINLSRIYHGIIFLVPVHIAHVLIFLYNLTGATGAEYSWRIGIILSHATVMLLVSIYGLTAYYAEKRKANKLGDVIQGLAFMTYLLFGAVIVSIDQLVTTNMTPFIISNIAMAVIFLTRPLHGLLGYGTTLLVFYYLIGIAQTDADILLSLRVNGITATGVGLCIAFLMWKNTVTNLNYQEQLAAKTRELTELNKLKDQLFAIVSHDIRSPLATLVGLTDILESEKEQMPQDTAKIVSTVNRNVKGTFAMVENLLTWFRSQITSADMVTQDLQLAAVAEQTVAASRSRAEAKNIQIVTDIPADLWVNANRESLNVIIRNLVHNAIKFSHPHGKIVVKAQREGNEIVVSVQDNGVGIEPERLRLILEGSGLGSVASTTGTMGERGTGLGLLICKELVQRHGGRLWAESTLGAGCSFYFSVPAANPAN
jgi:signal transduction histidine kinase